MAHKDAVTRCKTPTLPFTCLTFLLAIHTQAGGYRHETISQFHVTHKSLLGITLARRRKILKTVLTPFLDTLKLSENFVAIWNPDTGRDRLLDLGDSSWKSGTEFDSWSNCAWHKLCPLYGGSLLEFRSSLKARNGNVKFPFRLTGWLHLSPGIPFVYLRSLRQIGSPTVLGFGLLAFTSYIFTALGHEVRSRLVHDNRDSPMRSRNGITFNERIGDATY